MHRALFRALRLAAGPARRTSALTRRPLHAAASSPAPACAGAAARRAMSSSSSSSGSSNSSGRPDAGMSALRAARVTVDALARRDARKRKKHAAHATAADKATHATNPTGSLRTRTRAVREYREAVARGDDVAVALLAAEHGEAVVAAATEGVDDDRPALDSTDLQLVSKCAKLLRLGLVDDAWQTFSAVKRVCGIGGYNLMIASGVQSGRIDEARRYFDEAIRVARLQRAAANGEETPTSAAAAADEAKADDAAAAAAEREADVNGAPVQPDRFTFTRLASAYAQQGDLATVLDLCADLMQREFGWTPDEWTWTTVLLAASKARDTNALMQLYEQMRAHAATTQAEAKQQKANGNGNGDSAVRAFHIPVDCYNTVLTGLAHAMPAPDMRLVRRVFRDLQNSASSGSGSGGKHSGMAAAPDDVTHTVLLTALARSGSVDDALEHVRAMRTAGVPLTRRMFGVLLPMLVKAANECLQTAAQLVVAANPSAAKITTTTRKPRSSYANATADGDAAAAAAASEADVAVVPDGPAVVRVDQIPHDAAQYVWRAVRYDELVWRGWQLATTHLHLRVDFQLCSQLLSAYTARKLPPRTLDPTAAAAAKAAADARAAAALAAANGASSAAAARAPVFAGGVGSHPLAYAINQSYELRTAAFRALRTLREHTDARERTATTRRTVNDAQFGAMRQFVGGRVRLYCMGVRDARDRRSSVADHMAWATRADEERLESLFAPDAADADADADAGARADGR